VTTQAEYGIELFGPMRQDCSWQAKTPNSFDSTAFQIDWDEREVHCPRGKTSVHWSPRTRPGFERGVEAWPSTRRVQAP
jgi:transposase